MSSFDAEVSVLSAGIGISTEDEPVPFVELGIVSGLALPIPNPQTGEPIIIPFGQLRFKFTRSQGIEIFTAALQAAQDLPETTPSPSSRLVVAQNMSQVEQAHQNIRRATGQ